MLPVPATHDLLVQQRQEPLPRPVSRPALRVPATKSAKIKVPTHAPTIAAPSKARRNTQVETQPAENTSGD